MKTRLPLGVIVLAAASACTTASAARPIERPALEVPPPPPRVIAPLPLPDLPPVELMPEAPTNNSPTSPRSRAKAERPEPPKPDPKPETPPVTEPPPAAAPPATPVLRTPEGADNTQLLNQIRTSIGTANSILDKVTYASLSQQLQKAYDEARLFAKEADIALNAKNLKYAKELAEKAERLAKEVQNR
jgi:hypothetical protein